MARASFARDAAGRVFIIAVTAVVCYGTFRVVLPILIGHAASLGMSAGSHGPNVLFFLLVFLGTLGGAGILATWIGRTALGLQSVSVLMTAGSAVGGVLLGFAIALTLLGGRNIFVPITSAWPLIGSFVGASLGVCWRSTPGQDRA